MKPQLFSGARGLIKFTRADGQIETLAFVTDVSVSMSQNLRPSYVIGEIGPKTIEPLGEDANASIGRIIPINKQPAAGSTANAGPMDKIDAIDYGLEPRLNEMLTSESVEIVIYDKFTGTAGSEKVIGSLKHARFAGKSMSMSSTDLATERYNFVGIWDGSYSNQQVGDQIGYGFDE